MGKTSHTFSIASRCTRSTEKKQNLCKNCISIDSIDSQRNGMIRTMHAVVRQMRYMDKEMQRPLGSHKNKQAKILQGTHIEFFSRHSRLFPGHLSPHFSRSRCLRLDGDDPTDGAQTRPLEFEHCGAKLAFASFAALALTIFLCALQNLSLPPRAFNYTKSLVRKI